MGVVVSPAIRLPLPSEPSDEALVIRALTGDRWAEEALYRRHVHRVTSMVARLLRHGPDVEDVVQDTFVQAFRDLPALREPSYFGRWLLSSAVHRVHKKFRRRRLRRLLGLDRSLQDEPLAVQAKTGASQEARAELMLLDRALDHMGERDRVCWVLRHLSGHRISDVAELAGCSVATAKRRIARGDQHVAAHFGEGKPAGQRRGGDADA